MTYTILRPDELEWSKPSAGDQSRGILRLSDRLQHMRANIWRLPPGTSGRRHAERVQEEIFVVLEGTATMALGDPPRRVELAAGSAVIVEPGTALQQRNESARDTVILAIGAPREEPGNADYLPGRHVTKPERYTVDLSAYPDLVVIYLGMRVEEPHGVATLEALGPQIRTAIEEKPEGLLLHEELIYSQEPLHVGMRQYWRDFDSLEAWALALPHKEWWTDYLRDRGGTSFWHETYFRTGGFESMYVDVDDPPVGLGLFAPRAAATGPMFSARQRRDAEAVTRGAEL